MPRVYALGVQVRCLEMSQVMQPEARACLSQPLQPREVVAVSDVAGVERPSVFSYEQEVTVPILPAHLQPLFFLPEKGGPYRGYCFFREKHNRLAVLGLRLADSGSRPAWTRVRSM